MTAGSYNQFCPVAMASEILCSRWTLILIRELVVGSTRFNDLRRGVPRMSPALLSKRLKQLEAAGVVCRKPAPDDPDILEYHLTPAGLELKPVIETIGCWGQKWFKTDVTLRNLDVGLLMWDIRRNLNTEPMPQTRSTIQFIYSDLPDVRKKWWLIIDPGQDVDLCSIDPGFDVNLFVTVDLLTMTEVWMGHSSLGAAREAGSMHLVGDRKLERAMESWLGFSPFAQVDRSNGAQITVVQES